ncbi:MAG: hypothetical protein Q4B46_02785 [Comamonadaceae bacterium]|nr:hypothetical protein [Comamonadaceae bacterium]
MKKASLRKPFLFVATSKKIASYALYETISNIKVSETVYSCTSIAHFLDASLFIKIGTLSAVNRFKPQGCTISGTG